ncbi:hypothetical protein [Lentzea sp. NPDC092896]|uniref:hypothetical protein n=1 Tax=Lentzea sp. NPDC092896 TaxID=3364127 RepID=UPI00381623F5
MPRRKKKLDHSPLSDEVSKLKAVLVSMGVDLDLPYPDEWHQHTPDDASPEFVAGAAFAVRFLQERLALEQKRFELTQPRPKAYLREDPFQSDLKATRPVIGL